MAGSEVSRLVCSAALDDQVSEGRKPAAASTLQLLFKAPMSSEMHLIPSCSTSTTSVGNRSGTFRFGSRHSAMSSSQQTPWVDRPCPS